MQKTCLSYNGLLLLQILEDCDAALEYQQLDTKVRAQVKVLKENTSNDLKKHKLNIGKLKKHQLKQLQRKPKKNISDLEEFISQKELFLNEHRFFCRCNASYGDSLIFETGHEHIQKKWVKEASVVLEDIIAEFTLARIEYYKSYTSISLTGLNTQSFSRNKIFRNNIKSTLLKSAFRRCYSILDSIGIATLKIEEKDYNNLTDKHGNKVNVYFLNLWDYELFDDKDFKSNQFLHSLFSITKDLDRTEYSALKEYKSIRNDIEHNTLILNDDIEKKPSAKYYKEMSIDKMMNATENMLYLTREAIFAFVYFVRHRSKSK